MEGEEVERLRRGETGDIERNVVSLGADRRAQQIAHADHVVADLEAVGAGAKRIIVPARSQPMPIWRLARINPWSASQPTGSPGA